jgi:hypothetical protein
MSFEKHLLMKGIIMSIHSSTQIAITGTVGGAGFGYLCLFASQAVSPAIPLFEPPVAAAVFGCMVAICSFRPQLLLSVVASIAWALCLCLLYAQISEEANALRLGIAGTASAFALVSAAFLKPSTEMRKAIKYLGDLLIGCSALGVVLSIVSVLAGALVTAFVAGPLAVVLAFIVVVLDFHKMI